MNQPPRTILDLFRLRMESILARPGMHGSPPMLEGGALGLLACWDVVTAEDPERTRWHDAWRAECRAVHRRDEPLVTLADTAVPDAEIARRRQVWPAAAERVADVLDRASWAVWEYYRVENVTRPSPSDRHAMDRIESMADRFREERLRDGSYEAGLINGWPPDVLEGFSLARSVAMEDALLGGRRGGRIVDTAYRAAQGALAGNQRLIAEIACEEQDSFLRTDSHDPTHNATAYAQVVAGICKMRDALMG